MTYSALDLSATNAWMEKLMKKKKKEERPYLKRTSDDDAFEEINAKRLDCVFLDYDKYPS